MLALRPAPAVAVSPVAGSIAGRLVLVEVGPSAPWLGVAQAEAFGSVVVAPLGAGPLVVVARSAMLVSL